MASKHTPVTAIALLSVALLTAAGTAVLAAGPQSDKDAASKQGDKKSESASKKPSTEKEEPPKLYTNADLERLFGPPPPAPQDKKPPAAGTEKKKEEPDSSAPDALTRLQEDQGRERTRELQAVRAQHEVQQAEAEVKRLEQRKLRIENPLLPPPELTPEEQAQWKGLDNAQRLKLTEKQLEDARQALDDARTRLDKLQGKAGS